MASGLSALILAAGFSSRMGDLKALLPLGAQTMLEQSIGLFRDCGVAEVVVVTGHRAGEVEAVARAAGARVVHNPEYARGMFGSIRAGLAGISAASAGVFLLPVDIPLLRSGTIRLLTAAFAAAPALLCYPVFAGRRGHPPLLHADCLAPILRAKEPEGGLRTLLAGIEADHPERIREVQVADAHIHRDLDTPEQFVTGSLCFTRRDQPTMAECAAILNFLHPMPEKGLAHGRAVAEMAVALATAINRHSGGDLDVELCRVSGWLHDIAKGHPHHEAEGGRWLRHLGFDRAAAIVEAHKDLPWTPDMAIGERELVHLADKLVRGRRVVGIDKRFEEKLALYREDPAAVAAIRQRYDQARHLATRVEAEMGQPLRLLAEMADCPCKT